MQSPIGGPRFPAQRANHSPSQGHRPWKPHQKFSSPNGATASLSDEPLLCWGENSTLEQFPGPLALAGRMANPLGRMNHPLNKKSPADSGESAGRPQFRTSYQTTEQPHSVVSIHSILAIGHTIRGDQLGIRGLVHVLGQEPSRAITEDHVHAASML